MSAPRTQMLRDVRTLLTTKVVDDAGVEAERTEEYTRPILWVLFCEDGSIAVQPYPPVGIPLPAGRPALPCTRVAADELRKLADLIERDGYPGNGHCDCGAP